MRFALAFLWFVNSHVKALCMLHCHFRSPTSMPVSCDVFEPCGVAALMTSIPALLTHCSHQSVLLVAGRTKRDQADPSAAKAYVGDVCITEGRPQKWGCVDCRPPKYGPCERRLQSLRPNLPSASLHTGYHQESGQRDPWLRGRGRGFAVLGAGRVA